MAAYFICLVIVVCLSVALPAHGCNVLGDDGLAAFESGDISKEWLMGVMEFMDLTELYTKALQNIDVKWPTKPWKELKEEDRHRKLSVGLMKCHTFVEHMQCSMANRTTKNMISIQTMMKDIKRAVTEKESSESIMSSINSLCSFTQIFTDYIIHFGTILYLMGYGPAMWVPMSLIIFEDILTSKICRRDKITISNDNIEDFIADTDYLLNTVDKIKTNLNNSIIHCTSSNIPIPTIDSSTLNHNTLKQHMSHANEEFEKRTGVYYSYDKVLCLQFDISGWLLLSINERNLKNMLTRPEWEYLEITWDDERNFLSKTAIGEYNELKATNKHWRMHLFTDPLLSRYNTVNQIRDLYRIVVMRFTLIAVSECDRLRNQVEQLKPSIDTALINLLKNTFMENCKKISSNVQDAIKYLRNDQFLERLAPELSYFVDSFGKNVSTIVVGLMQELNSISGLLKVIGALSYSTNEESLISNNQFDAVEFVKLLRLEDAKKYTVELQENFPTINFQVANIMMSARDHWIPALY